jgi:hypothetical protein
VGERRRRSRRSRGASIVLAALGALAALVGGFLLYARQEIFQPDNLANRAKSALRDERLRLAIAQPIVDGIVDSGSGDLVNARPLIESVVVSALGTPPAKAAFAEGVRSVDAKLTNRSPNTLLLNLTDATVVAAKALDALAPQLGNSVPKQIDDVKTAILQSRISITPLRFVHQIDLLGLILPFVALLLLGASVAIAPLRRLAVQRAGVAVAVAGVFGLVSLIVSRSLALSQIADPLFRDGAAALWDALLGDLLVWTVGVGFLALILAAAARYGAAEIDPLAPFAKAATLARTHPSRPVFGVLRGLLIGLTGLVLILKPSLSLQVFAVGVGAWLIYVAVVELLGILAPVQAGGEGKRAGRQFAPKRLAVAGAVLIGFVTVVLLVGDEHRSGTRPVGAPEACNGYPELCGKRLDQITIPSTHNSMSAAAEPGWFLPNQRYGITRQLNDGIRGLLIDTHYGVRRGTGRGFGEVITDLGRENTTRQEVTEQLGAETVDRAEQLVGRLAFGEKPQGQAKAYLCHVLCELGATDLDVALKQINTWMQTHPDEFLVIFIEDVVSPQETAEAFERSGLLRYAYEPPAADAIWPTMGQLIEQDKRLLLMAENDNGGGKYPWYQDGFDLVQETPYTFNNVEQITGRSSCRPNRGNPDNALFQINNWIEKIPRDPILAGQIDSKDVLLPRARLCSRIRGLKPNIIAVDFYNEGDLFEVSRILNGVAADATPEVRTVPAP